MIISGTAVVGQRLVDSAYETTVTQEAVMRFRGRLGRRLHERLAALPKAIA